METREWRFYWQLGFILQSALRFFSSKWPWCLQASFYSVVSVVNAGDTLCPANTQQEKFWGYLPPSFTYKYLTFWKCLWLIWIQSLLSLGDRFCVHICVKWLFHLKILTQTYMHLISEVPKHIFFLVKGSFRERC